MGLKLIFSWMALALAAGVVAQNNNTGNTLADLISTNSQTTMLYKALTTYDQGLLSMLQGNSSNGNTTSNYTIFAPTDASFTPQVLALLPNIKDLNSIFLYHVLNGTYHPTDFHSGSNIIDTLVSNSTYLKWSNASGLPLDIYKNSSSGGSSSSSDTGLTVFFGIGSARVIQSDISSSNGVLYLIDTIMNLPQSPSFTMTQTPRTSSDQLNEFSLLANQSGQGDNLNSANGITIFVPYNSAFSNTNYSAFTTDTLSTIVKYHFVNQVLYSTNISSLNGPMNFTTVEGDNITITPEGSGFTVGNYNTTAKVISADILTDNGVIHIIDTVLWPVNLTNGTNGAGGNGNPHGNSSDATRVSWASLVLSLMAVLFSLSL